MGDTLPSKDLMRKLLTVVRLRVKDLAEARGLNISSLQREAKIPMSTARRIWYSTSDGSEDGPPLKLVNLEVVDQLARFFGVHPGELLARVEEQ